MKNFCLFIPKRQKDKLKLVTVSSNVIQCMMDMAKFVYTYNTFTAFGNLEIFLLQYLNQFTFCTSSNVKCFHNIENYLKCGL